MILIRVKVLCPAHEATQTDMNVRRDLLDRGYLVLEVRQRIGADFEDEYLAYSIKA